MYYAFNRFNITFLFWISRLWELVFHPFVMNMKNIFTYYISMSIEGVVWGWWVEQKKEKIFINEYLSSRCRRDLINIGLSLFMLKSMNNYANRCHVYCLLLTVYNY